MDHVVCASCDVASYVEVEQDLCTICSFLDSDRLLWFAAVCEDIAFVRGIYYEKCFHRLISYIDDFAFETRVASMREVLTISVQLYYIDNDFMGQLVL